jgi:cell division protein FtsB
MNLVPALYAALDRLRAEINTVRAERDALRAERDDLRAQVTALRTLRELDIQWLHGLARFADAVEVRP